MQCCCKKSYLCCALLDTLDPDWPCAGSSVATITTPPQISTHIYTAYLHYLQHTAYLHSHCAANTKPSSTEWPEQSSLQCQHQHRPAGVQRDGDHYCDNLGAGEVSPLVPGPGIHTQDIVWYIQSSYDIGLLTDHWLGRYQTQTVLFVTLLSPCSGSSVSAREMWTQCGAVAELLDSSIWCYAPNPDQGWWHHLDTRPEMGDNI